MDGATWTAFAQNEGLDKISERGRNRRSIVIHRDEARDEWGDRICGAARANTGSVSAWGPGKTKLPKTPYCRDFVPHFTLRLF